MTGVQCARKTRRRINHVGIHWADLKKKRARFCEPCTYDANHADSIEPIFAARSEGLRKADAASAIAVRSFASVDDPKVKPQYRKDILLNINEPLQLNSIVPSLFFPHLLRCSSFSTSATLFISFQFIAPRTTIDFPLTDHTQTTTNLLRNFSYPFF